MHADAMNALKLFSVWLQGEFQLRQRPDGKLVLTYGAEAGIF